MNGKWEAGNVKREMGLSDEGGVSVQGFRPTWTALKRGERVWGSKQDSPLLLYRHRRWHFITLGPVLTPEFKTVPGIRTVNFMSTARARQSVADWLPYYQLLALSEVAPNFEQEVRHKILPMAADYRPWLHQGWVKIVGGFTTDTLEALPYKPVQEEQLVAQIQAMMKRGAAGPFLSFERSAEGWDDIKLLAIG